METIDVIKQKLSSATIQQLPNLLNHYSSDKRKGVQKLILSYHKKIEATQREYQRLENMSLFEKEYYQKGFTAIAGIDEVGRGPLAGPVVAAAVILPKNCKIEGVNDSKKLSAQKRETLYSIICQKAISYGIGVVTAQRIDEINILQATFEAMQQALSKLSVAPDFILADAVHIPNISTAQRGIIGGDGKSISIAAASIVAKVTRDTMMQEYSKIYTGYGFEKNKGYGSQEHIKAIQTKGLCAIHRKTFVKNILFDNQKVSKNKQKGQKAEQLALQEMQKLGYTILEQNFRRYTGEIDIIAKKENLIVFTEVKFRQSEKNGLPCEAVTTQKQNHIIQTANIYLSENQISNSNIRFDVAEILQKQQKLFFRYIENAFWLE